MESRKLAAAGIIAGATYCAGDIMLFGGDEFAPVPNISEQPGNDPNIWWMFQHSPRRLQLGALAGVVAAPFWFAGTAGVYRALRADRATAPLATAAACFAVAGHSMASFIHATFYPYGATYQLAQQMHGDGIDEPEVERVTQHARHIGRTIKIAYPIYGALQLTSSVLMSIDILSGRSSYPRWAAAAVPPLVPVAVAIAATGAPQARKSRLAPLRGAGLSIGWIASYAAASLISRKTDAKS